MLKSALTPYLNLIELDIDKSIVEAIYPNPSNFPSIIKNKPLDIFLIFKNNIKLSDLNTTVKLTCFDSRINTNLTFTSQIC